MRTATAEGRSATSRRGRAALLAIALLAGCFGYAWWTGRTPDVPGPNGTVLVTYVHEGGFAGGRRITTVTADGTLSVESDGMVPGAGATRHLTEDRLEDLRTALDAAHFEDLEDSYRPEACMDCFVETVTYRGHTVTVEGHVGPPELADALRLIGDLAGAA